MNEKTILAVGGIVLVGGVLLLISQKQSQAAQQQALATTLANQPATISSGLGTLLGDVGSAFQSGSLQSLFSGFGGSNGSGSYSNEPGLTDDTGDYSNSPGLISGDSEDDGSDEYYG